MSMTNTVNPTLSVVRVTNTGDEDFADAYASQPYMIPAGGESFVPFDAACLWLGDPRKANIGPQDKHRTEEYQRVMARCGTPEWNEQWFAEYRPKLAVHMTNGTPVPMVADEPDGAPFDPFFNGERVETEAERIAKLERLVASLSAQQGQEAVDTALGDLVAAQPTADLSKPRRAAPAPADGPPEDAPARVKAGR